MPGSWRRADKCGTARKKAISLPFDFHHVTHTGPRHFARLDRGSQNELITEFVAIRAAQRPKSTLQGIQASDLCDVTPTDQSAPEVQHSSVAFDRQASAAGHQSNQGSLLRPLGSTENSRTLRTSTSIENFSRPAPWSPKAPTPPPPRTSSRRAPTCSAPAPATTTPALEKRGRAEGDLLDNTKSALHSRSHATEPHLSASHAITTNDNSTSPTKISTTPTESGGTNSGLIGSLTTLPLRHVSSCPTTKLLSQQHRHHRSQADQRRPESPQPIPISQWEDVVDYSYEQAAEADCNFDWSQKTVYVDGDLESTNASTSESQSVVGSSSCNDEQSQVDATNDSRPCSGAVSSPKVAAMNSVDLQHVSSRSDDEPQDCQSPSDRHPPPRAIGRYHPLAQTSSKPSSGLKGSRDGACVVDDAYLQKEACDGTELELSVDQSATPERYSSESSVFGLRPLLNKYSSDGSLLSSTTSTIRTYRSSNSVGSLPELIYSLNNSRENFNGEKTSPTDSIASGSHPFPPRVPSATRLQLQAEIATAERLPLSCSSSAISAKAAALVLPSMSPLSPISLPDVLAEPASKAEGARSINAKAAAAASMRQRSASAVTPGQCQRVRGSYSLFPTSQSPNRQL